MAKQLVGQAKFQVPGGQATPAPPVGTSLGKFGINLGQFVQAFNDRTFDFITKSPPAASLLKKAAGIAKGSGVPNRDKVAKVTVAQVDEICKQKMADLNASSIETARQMIAGTARSMGIDVVDE